MQFEEHEGTISDMVMNDENNMLYEILEDGTISSFEIPEPYT